MVIREDEDDVEKTHINSSFCISISCFGIRLSIYLYPRYL